MLTPRHVLALAGMVLATSACGDHDPTGGFADPCLTPMAPVLHCPARSGHAALPVTAADACRKLVSCGVLAASNLEVLGTTRPCQVDSDCVLSSGEACQQASDGRLWCHTPVLDQRWCHLRLSGGGVDPCDKKQSFTSEIVGNVLRCIADTTCETLGLPFSHKKLPVDSRPQLDLFTCENKSHIWTATACDHGLLRY